MAIAAVAAAATGDTAVVAASANRKVRVRGFYLHNGAATANNVKWRSGTTDITGLMYSAAAVGPIANAFSDKYLFETAVGSALNLNCSAATAVGGFVVYELES